MTNEQQKAVEAKLIPTLPRECPMCHGAGRPVWGVRKQLVVLADADPAEEHRSDWRHIVVTCNHCNVSVLYSLQRIMGPSESPDDWWR